MLTFSTYKNAVLIPDNSGYGIKMRGGIYTKEHQIIDNSLLYRHNNRVIQPTEYKHPKQHLHGDYVFGGYVFNHYGHAIIDTLNKIWYSKYTENPFIFTTPNKFVQGFLELHNDLFSITNIPKPTYIDVVTTIENITIPSAGINIPNFVTSEQIDALGTFDAGVFDMKHKLWLSRSSYNKSTAPDRYNENRKHQKNIEQKLADNGWLIFNPDQYPLKKQLQTICESYIVAGFESSAFHSLLLLKNYKGKIIMYNRGRPIPKIHFLIREKLSMNWDIINIYPLYCIDKYLNAL